MKKEKRRKGNTKSNLSNQKLLLSDSDEKRKKECVSVGSGFRQVKNYFTALPDKPIYVHQVKIGSLCARISLKMKINITTSSSMILLATTICAVIL